VKFAYLCKKIKDIIMTFCIWCKEQYSPHKSPAKQNKRYCSLQCEEAAEKAEKK
jgi:hypothetical protein